VEKSINIFVEMRNKNNENLNINFKCKNLKFYIYLNFFIKSCYCIFTVFHKMTRKERLARGKGAKKKRAKERKKALKMKSIEEA